MIRDWTKDALVWLADCLLQASERIARVARRMINADLKRSDGNEQGRR